MWDPAVESLDLNTLRALQVRRLRSTLRDSVRRFGRYRELFGCALEANASETDEVFLNAFERLPIVGPDDYASLDEDLLGGNDRSIFFLENSTGTTGTSKSRFATFHDDLIDREMIVRSFVAAGVVPGDKVVVVDLGDLTLYMLFAKALALMGVHNVIFYSARVPIAHSLSEVLAFKPTVLIVLPSIVLQGWSVLLRERGCLRKLIYTAESLPDEHRQHLSDLGVESFSVYGAIELGFVAAECGAHEGLHIWGDTYLCSVTGTDTPSQDENGWQEGELISTTLRHDGKPAIRYKIGDVVALTTQPCRCGRTLPRLRFVRRTAQVFSIFGSKFSAQEICRTLFQGGAVPPVQVRLEDSATGVLLTVVVPAASTDQLPPKATLLNRLRQHPGLSYMHDHGVLAFRIRCAPFVTIAGRKIKLIDDRRRDSR